AAPMLFRVLLDPKYADAAPMFAMLSMAVVWMSLNGLVAQAMQARGYFKSMFAFDVCFVPFEIGMFAIGAWLGGALGLCYMYMLSSF
ncbi:hypothetical protein NL432_26165, partial [Klebsiella pneumoniae]|nr:hypothetical protein [Klebsiella pneumoniae]